MYNFIYEKVNTIKEVEKLLSENEAENHEELDADVQRRLASSSKT